MCGNHINRHGALLYQDKPDVVYANGELNYMAALHKIFQAAGRDNGVLCVLSLHDDSGADGILSDKYKEI